MKSAIVELLVLSLALVLLELGHMDIENMNIELELKENQNHFSFETQVLISLYGFLLTWWISKKHLLVIARTISGHSYHLIHLAFPS